MPVTDFGDYLSLTFENVDQLNTDQVHDTLQKRLLPFAASSLYNVEIVSAEKLTKGDDVKNVYDLGLNVESIPFEYEPGDTVGILPTNDYHEVDQLLERLNLTSLANRLYLLSIIPHTTKKKAAIPPHIPVTSTLREVLLRCVDIRSIPKKVFLSSLIRYTTQTDEIELLQKLCSPSGSLQYNEFISKNRTLLKLLQTFPSCNPSIERLLENLPPLQPRPYSILSSKLSKQTKNELRIAFSVVDLDETVKGICTGWLETCIHTFNKQETESNIERRLSNLQITSELRVPLYFRKSNNFRLPTTPSRPIIMIGPGTGIAPFVGFLEHRSLQPHIEFGTSWLFYGCRYNDRDFLYKNKILGFQENTLTKLCVSFSRESPEKLYVQDLIRQNKKEFVGLIRQQDAVVYVCGEAKNMLKDIKNAIVACLVDVEELLCAEAETYIKEMEKTNRYVTDVWL